MGTSNNDLIMRKNVFAWIALGTGLLLLIPLIAMQFTSEVNWNIKDFIVMGFLLFGTASLFVLASRRAPRKRRIVIGAMFVAAFIFIWAELAVGILFNLGS